MTTRALITRGFTLVEVLIALAVFGLVMAGIVQGVQYGFRATYLESRAVNGQSDLDAVTRVLHALVARMDAGTADTPPQIEGSASRIAFTTDLPAGANPFQRRADVAVFVDAAHNLLLRSTPHLHAQVRGQSPAFRDAVLLGELNAVRFSYLDPRRPGDASWADHWSEPYLPRLVRIHFDFLPSDGRHWPDIIASPAQDRPRE